MCIPMGSGATPEDRGTQGLHKGTALASSARIVLFSREWPVSRFGQKNETKMSTVRRSAWSRPTCGFRSACTSSPRRARSYIVVRGEVGHGARQHGAPTLHPGEDPGSAHVGAGAG